MKVPNDSARNKESNAPLQLPPFGRNNGTRQRQIECFRSTPFSNGSHERGETNCKSCVIFSHNCTDESRSASLYAKDATTLANLRLPITPRFSRHLRDIIWDAVDGNLTSIFELHPRTPQIRFHLRISPSQHCSDADYATSRGCCGGTACAFDR